VEETLIRVTPDKTKAESIIKMARVTVEMIKTIDIEKYSSNVVKEYYDVIRELMSVILLLDGYKVYGEGAHKQLIEYIAKNCKQVSPAEIALIDDLRTTRHKISYDGFFVKPDYVKVREAGIAAVIKKLENIIVKKLNLVI
jgi:hypothetical protein